jgi:hypothetical protein
LKSGNPTAPPAAARLFLSLEEARPLARAFNPRSEIRTGRSAAEPQNTLMSRSNHLYELVNQQAQFR